MPEIKILVSRHSAFYSPLIATIAAGFLKSEGYDSTYGVLPTGKTSRELIRAGAAHVIQSAVSSSFGPLDKGETDLPVHFAQINARDGFFLVARKPTPSFAWNDLHDKTVLADHAGQPLAMFKYACAHNCVDLERTPFVDAGSPEDMEKAFRAGKGDFVQLQSPAAHQLEVDGAGKVAVSVGASMFPVAFSSLSASREFVDSSAGRAFLRAYSKAREWVRQTDAARIAETEASFFPEFSREALTLAIAAYQKLGCWDGGVAIPRDLFQQALRVFGKSHPYESVVVTPAAG